MIKVFLNKSFDFGYSEADVEQFHKYIEQREQAVKAIEEFHEMKGLFASHYGGRYVAFYRGEVVDSDTDRRGPCKALSSEIRERPDLYR